MPASYNCYISPVITELFILYTAISLMQVDKTGFVENKLDKVMLSLCDNSPIVL